MGTLYNATVLPLFHHFLSIWDNCDKGCTDYLDRLQNLALVGDKAKRKGRVRSELRGDYPSPSPPPLSSLAARLSLQYIPTKTTKTAAGIIEYLP